MESITESVGKEVTTNMSNWLTALAKILGMTEDKLESLFKEL